MAIANSLVGSVFTIYRKKASFGDQTVYQVHDEQTLERLTYSTLDAALLHLTTYGPLRVTRDPASPVFAVRVGIMVDPPPAREAIEG